MNRTKESTENEHEFSCFNLFRNLFHSVKYFARGTRGNSGGTGKINELVPPKIHTVCAFFGGGTSGTSYFYISSSFNKKHIKIEKK